MSGYEEVYEEVFHRKIPVTSVQCDTRSEMLGSLDERRIVRSKRWNLFWYFEHQENVLDIFLLLIILYLFY